MTSAIATYFSSILGVHSRTVERAYLACFIGCLFVTVALFDTYNTERPYTRESAEKVVPDPLDLSQRSGCAILLQAGYAKAVSEFTESDPGAADKHSADIALKDLEHPDFDCLGYQDETSPVWKEVDLRALCKAIFAAEKYNRSPFQRGLKQFVASIILKLTGKLPEYSFGLAQLRPSTARTLLQEELGGKNLSEKDLFEILTNDCLCVHLAAKHIEALSRRFASQNAKGDLIAKVAMAYNGSKEGSIQGLRYVDAVTGAYDLLKHTELSESTEMSEPSKSTQTEIKRVCVRFLLDLLAGMLLLSSYKESKTQQELWVEPKLKFLFSIENRDQNRMFVK